MDPDMVRQQEEAEREALALAQRKLAPITPASPIAAAKSRPRVETSVAPPDGARASAAAGSGATRFLGGLGRFLTFGLAGAILGSGLGAAAIRPLELAAADAPTAIFGAAAFFALICAISGLSHCRP